MLGQYLWYKFNLTNLFYDRIISIILMYPFGHTKSITIYSVRNVQMKNTVLLYCKFYIDWLSNLKIVDKHNNLDSLLHSFINDFSRLILSFSLFFDLNKLFPSKTIKPQKRNLKNLINLKEKVKEDYFHFPQTGVYF